MSLRRRRAALGPQSDLAGMLGSFRYLELSMRDFDVRCAERFAAFTMSCLHGVDQRKIARLWTGRAQVRSSPPGRA
jgi:hypothetical protein